MTNTGTATKTRSRRSARIRAILVGGIVLGVGAAVTLAAWNDSEFATGSFAAGQFTLEGSTDGTAYADHEAAPGAPLAFTLDPDNLAPGDTVYAGFAVRLGANTSTGATVTVSGTGAGDNAANLSYELVQSPSISCAADTTGPTIATAGTALSGTPSAPTFGLSAGTPSTDAGAPVYLCFKVTAGPNLVQSAAATATWQFAAASN